jgi:hypothetical protein
MADPVCRHQQAVAAAAGSMAAVAAQIDLAVREADGPVERLGATIGRIGITLAMMQEALETTDIRLKWGLGQLRREYCCAIEDLQFHDRMSQHLRHLQDYLAGTGALLAREATNADGADPGGWLRLRDQLMRKLITESQRQLFGQMQPAPAHGPLGAHPPAAYARPGSIELF